MVVRRTRTGALAPACLVLLVLLLAGCGGSVPVADPPVSPPPTTTATHPPKRETPEHFIRRWAALEKLMENSGRVGAYLAASDACVSCRQLAARVSGFYRDGGYVRWAGRTIRSIRPYGSRGGGTTYAVRIVSAPTTYMQRAGAAPRRLSGGRSTELITVKREHATWQVIDFATLG